jgi:hypothetical protein
MIISEPTAADDLDEYTVKRTTDRLGRETTECWLACEDGDVSENGGLPVWAEWVQSFEIKIQRMIHGGFRVVEHYAVASIDGQELEGSAWKDPQHSSNFRLASAVSNAGRSLTKSSG